MSDALLPIAISCLINHLLSRVIPIVPMLQDCDIFYMDIATSIRKSEEILSQYKSVPNQLQLTAAINNLQVGVFHWLVWCHSLVG